MNCPGSSFEKLANNSWPLQQQSRASVGEVQVVAAVNMAAGKIKSKDLTYDANLPPFLQRLHAQKAGLGDQDRHERQIARPKREKVHDDEDEPTVVDESGETVTKAELEKMTASDKTLPEGVEDEKRPTNGEDASQVSRTRPSAGQAKVTDGTATKKRKAIKVISEDGDGNASNKDSNDESSAKPAAKKSKKKGKPIKLAFDEGDET